MFCVLRLTITGFVLPLSLVPLPFAQVCSFYQCVSPQKQCSSIFLGICSLMRLSAFTVIFSVSFTLSKLVRFRGVLVPTPALQFRMLCLFCFSFMLYSVFPAFFPSQRVFAGFVTFCLQPSFASQTMALCRVFLATSSLSFVFIWPCCFQRYFVFPALPHFLGIV